MPTTPDEPKLLQLSSTWYYPIKSDVDPVAVPVWPDFMADDEGSIRTIIHVKRDVPGREWYGEPSWISSLYYAYMEIQMGEYNVSGYSNDWTPRVFMETYEGYGSEIPALNPEEGSSGGLNDNGPQGFRDVLRSFFTNRGAVRAKWIHRNAPAGSTATKIHEFRPTQDHVGHKMTAELARDQIIIAHDWHNDLMVSTPGRLGGGDVFSQAFQAKYYTVIKPLEDMLVDIFNKVIRIVDQQQGGKKTETLSVGLVNLYAHMLSDTITTENEADSVSNEGLDDGGNSNIKNDDLTEEKE